MLYGIKAWHVFICSYFGILLTSWNKTPDDNMPRRHTDADECAGCLFLFIRPPPHTHFFFYFSITCWQRYCFIFCLQDPPVLLMSWKNINENSLDSIFAPYGFAEAVAPLKQSAVPSGHCGFCPLPVCPSPPVRFHLLPQRAAPVRE